MCVAFRDDLLEVQPQPEWHSNAQLADLQHWAGWIFFSMLDCLRILTFSFSLEFVEAPVRSFLSQCHNTRFSEQYSKLQKKEKLKWLNNLSEHCSIVEVRMFLLYFRMQQVPLCPYHAGTGNEPNHHCLSVCHYLQCWLIALSLTPSIPHCNCGLLPLYSCLLLVPFPLLLSFYHFLCVSLQTVSWYHPLKG